MTEEQLTIGLEIQNEIQCLKGELSGIEAISAHSDTGKFDDAYIMVSHMHWRRKFEVEKQDVLDCLRKRRSQIKTRVSELEEKFRNL